MTVEYRHHDGSGAHTVMTGCPVPGCDETFPENCGQGRTRHLARDHDADEFGDDPAAPEGSA